jgi:hypothetical protein
MLHTDMIGHFSKVGPLTDAQKLYTDEIASENADYIENGSKQGQG